MRITHITDCYLPRLGGIENQVHDLAAHQVSHGHAVHILTGTPAAPGGVTAGQNRYRTTTTEDTGVKVHRIATPATFGLPFHPRGYSLISRALRLLQPDVVHVHAGLISPFAWHGARAGRDLGLPLGIIWHVLLDGVEPYVRAGYRATGWHKVPFAAATVSGAAAQRLTTAIGRDDFTIIPMGVTIEPWLAAAAGPVPNHRPGTLRVAATQRFAPRKRTGALIDIVEEASRRLGRHTDGGPRIQVDLAGTGPTEAKVRAQVHERGLDELITLLGRVPRESLPERYRSRDVFSPPPSSRRAPEPRSRRGWLASPSSAAPGTGSPSTSMTARTASSLTPTRESSRRWLT